MALPVVTPENIIKIVAINGGYGYIGRVVIEADFIHMTSAKGIVHWGTSLGVGELSQGPTKTTKLGLGGTVHIPMTAVNCIIDTDQTKWPSV